MGQVPPKYFLPSAPYGASPGANAINPTQAAAQNPQTPLLPPNFTDPGTAMQNSLPSSTGSAARIGGGAGGGGGNPFNPTNRQISAASPYMRGLFG